MIFDPWPADTYTVEFTSSTDFECLLSDFMIYADLFMNPEVVDDERCLPEAEQHVMGSFTTTLDTSLDACLNCASCGPNELVRDECSAISDIACESCPANSWSLSNRTTKGLRHCNSEYELVGTECVACTVGKA